MSYRRRFNRINESVQTSFDMSDNGDNDEDVFEETEDEAAALANMPAIPPVPDGADPTMAMMLQFMQNQQQWMAQMQQQNQQEIRNLRRDLRPANITGPARNTAAKPPPFDLEKDKAMFATWKSKWTYFQTSSGISSITSSAQKSIQKRAALQLALSDDTIRWVNNLGLDADQMENADYIVNRLDVYIKGTTNPLVQVVELLGRKKSANESFEKFVTDLKEKAKLCAFDKVTNVGEWFLTSCICANIDEPEVRKKLLLEKKLTLEKAIEICQEEEKAAKTSKQLGGARSYAGAASGAEMGATSSYKQGQNQQKQGAVGQKSPQTGQQQQRRDQSHQRQSRGRSQSRGRHDDRQPQTGNSKPETRTCYSCGEVGHVTRDPKCTATGKTCSKCTKVGHFAKVC